jgi:hypothetical protein
MENHKGIIAHKFLMQFPNKSDVVNAGILQRLRLASDSPVIFAGGGTGPKKPDLPAITGRFFYGC